MSSNKHTYPYQIAIFNWISEQTLSIDSTRLMFARTKVTTAILDYTIGLNLYDETSMPIIPLNSPSSQEALPTPDILYHSPLQRRHPCWQAQFWCINIKIFLGGPWLYLKGFSDFEELNLRKKFVWHSVKSYKKPLKK